MLKLIILVLFYSVSSFAQMWQNTNSVPYYLQPASKKPEYNFIGSKTMDALTNPKLTETEAQNKIKLAVQSPTKKVINQKETTFNKEGIPNTISMPTRSNYVVSPYNLTNEKNQKINNLSNSMPSFSVSDKGVNSNQVNKSINSAKSISPTKILKQAVNADASLQKTKSGVATFSLFETKKVKQKNKKTGKVYYKTVRVKVNKVPSLNIGSEREISAEGFEIPSFKNVNVNYSTVKSLKTPYVMTPKQFAIALGAKPFAVTPIKEFIIPEMMNVSYLEKAIAKSELNLGSLNEITLKSIFRLSKNELKYLKALIFYHDNKCHSATGLYYDLLKTGKKDIHSIANLHLGICSHKMGLFSESIDRLLKVLTLNDDESTKAALNALLADLPLEHQKKLGNELSKFRKYNLLNKDNENAFNYVISKSFALQKKYNESLNYALKVESSSKYYTRAQYLAAVAEYTQGKTNASLKRQDSLLKYMDQNKIKDSVYPLVSVNLARMSFQGRAYKSAIKHYLEIDRNHPMWIQGLQEQAWSQLLVKDEAGAIGNMHSIHTPYFKAVYKPESYVVRGIGYLNFCQYADAYRSIKMLEKKYTPWIKSMQSFNAKNKKSSLNYYNTVSAYLKNPKQATVKGLPYQVIREIARHKDFLNEQEAINKLVDEKEQYKFLIGLINKDRSNNKWLMKKSRERIVNLNSNLKKAKTNKKLLPNVNQWKLELANEKNLISFYKFMNDNLLESKKGMIQFAKESRTRVKKLVNERKYAAASKLKSRLNKMETRLARVLKNNELLKFEIFSGAGVNIRYRMAGGKVGQKRLPATSEVKEQGMNWEFDGEFWEDEVGHYRSALKNVCPKK